MDVTATPHGSALEIQLLIAKRAPVRRYAAQKPNPLRDDPRSRRRRSEKARKTRPMKIPAEGRYTGQPKGVPGDRQDAREKAGRGRLSSGPAGRRASPGRLWATICPGAGLAAPATGSAMACWSPCPAAQGRPTGLALRGCLPLSSAQTRRAGCRPCWREYLNQGCVMRPARIRARFPGWPMRGSDRGSTADPGRRPAMDESSLIFIIVPIAIPIALFTGIALPFIAASRSGRSHARGQPAGAHELKRINAAKRKARPPKPGAHDVSIEYLYVPCARIRYNGYPAETRRWVQQVPIVKKTAELIYYGSDSWDRREAVVPPGCISRQEFETDTRCHDDCPRDIAAALVCAPHGRGHRHCVHFLAPGRHCSAPAGCGNDCPAGTRGVRCARHGYMWEHCPHGEDPCRHGYPAGVIPIPGHRHRPGPAGGLFFATREAAGDHLYRGERERAEQAARQAPRIRSCARHGRRSPRPRRRGRAVHGGAPPVRDGASARATVTRSSGRTLPDTTALRGGKGWRYPAKEGATGQRMGPCARSAAPIPRVSTRNLVPSQARRSITPLEELTCH